MRREDEGVRSHVVAERRFRRVADRGGDGGRRGIRPGLEKPSEKRVRRRPLIIEPGPERIAIVDGLRRRDVAVRARIRVGNELIDQLACDRTDSVGGNDIAGKRHARERILDGGAPGEIAVALRVRKDDDIRRVAPSVSVALVEPERKQFVLQERPAAAAAELILLQLRLRLRDRRKEVARLQRVIAIELPCRAVELVRAASGDDVDHGSRVAPVLGAVGMRLNLELLDRVGRRAHHESRVECVVVAGAVEQEVVGLVAHAVDVEAGGGGAEPARCRVASRTAQPPRRSNDARNQRAQLR